MRIAPGPGDADVSLERAADSRHGGRESLKDAEVQRRRLHPDVDRVLRRSGDVLGPCPLEETVVGTDAARGNRDARRLLQRRVEGNPLTPIVDVGDERLILVGLERAVGDLDVPSTIGTLTTPAIVALAVSRPWRPRFCSASLSTCARSTLRRVHFQRGFAPLTPGARSAVATFRTSVPSMSSADRHSPGGGP